MSKITTPAILCNITPYSESSLIIRAFSFGRGYISIIAKGWRKKAEKEQILRFWEYELVLSEPREEGLYILSEANMLTDYSHYPCLATWAAAECGIELLSQLIVPYQEYRHYYTLASEYLKYLSKVEDNAILIFWRLLERVFVLSGIGRDLQMCHECGTQATPYAFDQGSGDVICRACALDRLETGRYLELSDTASSVLSSMHSIGNHLNDFSLERSQISEINTLYFGYYQAHQKHKLKLKSMSVLLQLYPE
ncbi:MAG TPA: DNA repair protein RecO [Candidatus Cloacimonadota bacterium]|nr:DNA repair protein RecO [Candidatus Cloacimonadota bacterium]